MGNTRQNYIPSYSPQVPAEVAMHLTQLYTGLNQHDEFLNNQAIAAQNASQTPTSTTPTSTANGTLTIPAVTPTTGTQGSITIQNGIIMAFVNPT